MQEENSASSSAQTSNNTETSERIAISLENVWFSYGENLALENVNLTVPHLDFLGIIGPNGGGKSTLLKCILGIYKVDKGRITIYGKDTREGGKFLGYVPQYSTFDKQFPAKVLEVVLMGTLKNRRWFNRITRKHKQQAKAVLERVGLYDKRNRHISQLSGGEQQRLLIARALVGEPEILLLDEPTASLDTTYGKNLFDLLSALNDELTIVMVTHDIGVLSAYVKTIACLNKRMFSSRGKEITQEMLDETYKCPVDLIAHGLPHRVLPPHDHKNYPR